MESSSWPGAWLDETNVMESCSWPLALLDEVIVSTVRWNKPNGKLALWP